MCTILFSWKSTKNENLVLLANRDEFYRRPTKTAHWWEDFPDILAGRDMQAGGTWMGINKNGRIAAITNYRKFPMESYATSRGDLVKRFLTGRESQDSFLNFLNEKGDQYDGFNLIFGNLDEIHYFSNRGNHQLLKPGLYGLSNHLLDTPWPKVANGKKKFQEILENGNPDKEHFFELLSDKERARDIDLPDTGIGLEKERMLSSIFIKSPDYGTRLSTVLRIDKSGLVDFHERSFVPENENKFSFKIG